MRAAVYHGTETSGSRMSRRRARGGRGAARGAALGHVRHRRDGLEGRAARPSRWTAVTRSPGTRGRMVFGHEFIGEVVEQGEGATTPVGALVASGAGVSCGQCDRCRQGRTNLCRAYYTLGLNTAGGMAEFVAVPESTLVPVPAGLSLDAAGLGPAARRRACTPPGAPAPHDGDQVVLIGAGAIGTFVLTGLRSLADGRPDRRRLPGSAAGPRRAARRRPARRGRPDAPADGRRGGRRPGRRRRHRGQRRTRPARRRHRARRGRAGPILQVGLPAAPAGDRRLVPGDAGDHRPDHPRPRLRRRPRTGAGPPRHVPRLARSSSRRVHPLGDLAEQLDRLASGRLEGKILFDPDAWKVEMKAAVFHGEHDIRVEDVRRPDRRPERARCSCARSGAASAAPTCTSTRWGPIVIPADRTALNGSQLPQVLGHEFSAEVVEVGAATCTKSPAGQRVSVMPLLYCGACYYCRRGLNHLCVSMACIGLSFGWGGIAELAVVPATHVSVAAGRASPTCRARSSSRPPSRRTAWTSPGCAPATPCWSPAPGRSARWPRCTPSRSARESSSPRSTRPGPHLARSLDVGDVLDPSAGRRRGVDQGPAPRASASTPSSSAPATSARCRRRSPPSARPAGSPRPACTRGPPPSTRWCSPSTTSRWPAPGATRSPTGRGSSA